MLATVAKSAKNYTRQVQCGDPWVIQLADAAMQDQDYLAMVHSIENGVPAKELHEKSELKLCEGILGDLSTFTLKTGQTLILKGNQEAFIPAIERNRILEITHGTHLAYDSMIAQLRGNLFWPKMRDQVKLKYNECIPCAQHHISTPQKNS